jgi:hypothetical protein
MRLRERVGGRLHETPNLMVFGRRFENYGQRKAAEAEPRRPEGTDWLGFSF